MLCGREDVFIASQGFHLVGQLLGFIRVPESLLTIRRTGRGAHLVLLCASDALEVGVFGHALVLCSFRL